MKNAIPLVLLLLFVTAVIVIVGGRSTHNARRALASHHPDPVVESEGTLVSASQPEGLNTTAAEPATTVAHTKRLKPRHRGVYRPHRPAKPVVNDWVRIPGTGIGLWPKPKN
jgi:hypothetical protein